MFNGLDLASEKTAYVFTGDNLFPWQRRYSNYPNRFLIIIKSLSSLFLTPKNLNIMQNPL